MRLRQLGLGGCVCDCVRITVCGAFGGSFCLMIASLLECSNILDVLISEHVRTVESQTFGGHRNLTIF